jgi:N-acetylmuramoyl-L-alanine amidase
MHRLFLSVVLCCICAVGAEAQQLRALARLDPAGSGIEDVAGGVAVTLALTQAVPYRVFTLDAPMRVVLDFRELAFDGDVAALDRSERITGLAAGLYQPGWSRLVLELDRPMEVIEAGLETDASDGDAVVRVTMAATSAEAFAASAGTPEPRRDKAMPVAADDGRLVVVLDPGHGGVDPGAQRGGHNEADLMLGFARELKEALLRGGVDDVVMTRTDDRFVSLPARVSVARAAGADLFLSLHADAIAKGRATGTTIYTLSQDATDAASAALAERQDRLDILAGVDLRAQDDQIATVLMGLARLQTAPRTDRLADEMVTGLQTHLGKLHKRPRLEAAFSVLKAPDIPSVLIELGFMSSETDLANLTDPRWRARAADGIVAAVNAWALDDTARSN